MRAAGSSPWRIETDASRPVLMALYLRDALGIVDPSGLPRLLGTGLAPVTHAPDPLVGFAWTRLWLSIVEPESRLAELPLDGPPAFDAAVRRHLDDARTFAQVAHDEHALRSIERYEEHPELVTLLPGIVAAHERTTDRVAEFRLRVEVLPLTARGVWWIAERAVAVDELLLDDPDAYRAALDPILERLV